MPHTVRISCGSLGSVSIFRRSALDERVDAPLSHKRVVTPHALHECLPAEDDAGVARKKIEHVELVAGQLDFVAVHARVPTRRIDRQTLDGDRPRVVADPRHKPRRARTAQKRANARDELADAERLGQIVICPALEPEDLVRFFAPRREHQDRDIAIRGVAPDGAADGDAIESGKHQIQDNEIERLGARQAKSFVAVTYCDRFQPLEREVQRDEVADMRLVFDHQHPRARRVGAALVRIHVISVDLRGRARQAFQPCHRFFTATPRPGHGYTV